MNLLKDEEAEARRIIGSTEEFLERYPNNIPALNRIGRALLFLGDYKGALDILTEIVERNPKNSETHENLGDTYIALGRILEATESLDMAIQIDSRSARAHSSRGLIANVEGDYEVALRYLDRAIRLDRDLQAPYGHRGDAYRMRNSRSDRRLRKNREKAEWNYRKSLSLFDREEASRYSCWAAIRAERGLADLGLEITGIEKAALRDRIVTPSQLQSLYKPGFYGLDRNGAL